VRRNIFIREYDRARENILTENLMDFLSNSNIKILNRLLDLIGITTNVRDIKNIKFEMQQKEEKSIPDASIYDKGNFYIHIEAKRFAGSIRELQLERHFNALKNKLQKKKVLLIVTNDYDEPIELKRFREAHKNREIKVRFLNWGQIRDFVNNIPKAITDKKDRFLIEQYLEYLEDEKMTHTKWSGFKRQDESDWANFIEFYENLKKILFEIKEYIREKQNWEEHPASQFRPDSLWFDFVTWRIRTKICRCYIGIELSKKYGGAIIYVGWHWSRRLEKRLLQNRKFNISIKRLVRKGYVSDDKSGINDFYKNLILKDLMKKKDASSQRKEIFRFIDKAARDFKTCGLDKLIKRV
jgi:hypothetical protein